MLDRGLLEQVIATLAGRVRDGTVIVADAVEVLAADAELPLVLEDCELRIGHPASADEVLRSALRTGV